MVQRTNARNQIYDDYRDNNHMTRDQVIQQTRAYQLKQSGKTNVCCINIKDGSMAVAIYASIYGFLQLFIFGWQTGVLSECSAVTMSQANLQCEWNCPCVGASTARTARLIEGLFIVQVICLISSFFMLFASLALVYGVHKASRYFIWPWFPVMLSSILTTMAYCVLWWTGDVRDYWLAITIVETIAQFINCYCFVVIISFYNRLAKSGGYKKEYTPGKAIHFDDNVREINEDHIELPQRNYHETPIEDQNLKYYNDTKFIEPSFYDDHHFVKENCGNCGNLLVYTEDGATCLSKSCRNKLMFGPSTNAATAGHTRKYTPVEVGKKKDRRRRDKDCCSKKHSRRRHRSVPCECRHRGRNDECSHCDDDYSQPTTNSTGISDRSYESRQRSHSHHNIKPTSSQRDGANQMDNLYIPQNIVIPSNRNTGTEDNGQKYVIDSQYTFEYKK